MIGHEIPARDGGVSMIVVGLPMMATSECECLLWIRCGGVKHATTSKHCLVLAYLHLHTG